jgi:putative iron-only hydrogenase system regulator
MDQHAVGVVAIIVKDRAAGARAVNEALSKYGDLIIGRLGLPYPQRDLHIITLIVDATTDQIGAMTGQLGMIKDVTVKSTLAKV